MSRVVKVNVVLQVTVPDDARYVSLDYNFKPQSWVDKPKKGGQVWCMDSQYNPPRQAELANWDQLCFRV